LLGFLPVVFWEETATLLKIKQLKPDVLLVLADLILLSWFSSLTNV